METRLLGEYASAVSVFVMSNMTHRGKKRGKWFGYNGDLSRVYPASRSMTAEISSVDNGWRDGVTLNNWGDMRLFVLAKFVFLNETISYSPLSRLVKENLLN